MLERIFEKFSVNLPRSGDLSGQWSDRGEQGQIQKAGFVPVADEAIEASDAQYYSDGHRSFLIQSQNRKNRNMVFPIRALYNTGITFLINAEDSYPINHTIAVEGACRFRMAAMDAALTNTPCDLLVLLHSIRSIPSPRTWEQSTEWQTKEFDPNEIADLHSTYRHAVALLAQRFATPAADFIAFKEAAHVIDKFGLFQTETHEGVLEQERLGNVVCDIFPGLRLREGELLSRKIRLAWRPEGPDQPPVVPNDKIGVDGFT